MDHLFINYPQFRFELLPFSILIIITIPNHVNCIFDGLYVGVVSINVPVVVKGDLTLAGGSTLILTQTSVLQIDGKSLFLFFIKSLLYIRYIN